MTEQKSGFIGIYSNVAETQAPPGTLIEAENVVVRKPGCVEPRDGLSKELTVSGGHAAWGFSWKSKDFYQRNNGSNVFAWRDTAGSSYQYADPILGNVDPQPLRRDIFSRAEARANLYVPCETGVLKLETDSGNFAPAGIHHAFILDGAYAPSSTYGSWLPNNEKVAYRAVLKNTDTNGVITRSLPSGYLVLANTSGVAAGCKPRIYVATSTYALIDEIELYRTRNFPVANAVDDEMQLVATIQKTSLTALAFSYYIDYTDSVAVADRGATLYSSPSQGGIERQNERPPAAACTALYRGSVFFGNVRGPRRITVSGSFTTSGYIATTTGLGVRGPTSDRTSGTNTLLNVSSTAGIEKGMVIIGVGIPFGAYVTNIAGTTVTMSVNASSTAVGAVHAFYDAMKIAGSWIPVAGIAYQTPQPYIVPNISGAPMLSYNVTPPVGGYTHTFVIEAFTRGTTAQTIQATHGSEYNPPLPNYDGTPLALEQDTLPGALYWSKTDEPEHVAPGNYAFVGDQRKAILGLVTTRDALFVLKEDGVFRLTGEDGTWRIDPFDPSVRCVLPSSVRVVNGRAVFLGNRGVMAVSDDGVEVLSTPINDIVKSIVDKVNTGWAGSGFYELTGISGASTACVLERESEYTLLRSSTDNPLVYNDITRAWTTLRYYAAASESYTYKAAFEFSRTGKYALSLASDLYTTVLSDTAGFGTGLGYLRYDRLTAITINSFASGTATLSAPITALEDDVIEDSNERAWRITADVSASASVPVVLMGGTASMGTGAGFLYRTLRCKVVVTGFSQPLPVQKRWTTFIAAWTELLGLVRLRYAYQSSESPTWVEEDANSVLAASNVVQNGYTEYDLGAAIPAYVPTASARAWLLRARIRWVQAYGQAQLQSVSAESVALPAQSQQVAV